MSGRFREIETKYDASDIDRMAFKNLVRLMPHKTFIYVESTDIYYSKGDEFIRYRMPPTNTNSKRAELTLKKKINNDNNVIRTEVNLRVDNNDLGTVEAFCKLLGYTKNFEIFKTCDIYVFDDANLVRYSVVSDDGKTSDFVEIEVDESLDITDEQAKEILLRYEKLLAPLGVTSHRRMKRSLWEIFKRENA